MIKKFLTIAVAVTALVFSASSSKADFLLGTTFYPIELLTSTATVNQASFSTTDGVGSTPVTLFTTGNFAAGNTASITFVPGVDGSGLFGSQPTGYAALLTNGVNDLLRLSIVVRNSGGPDAGTIFTDVLEKERFGLSSNDFAGNPITRIVFNLTSLTFTPVGSGTRATFDANLQVFGLNPLPEPGMLLSGIAMVGMAGLCRPRWRTAA